jgi:hypothetical protein
MNFYIAFELFFHDSGNAENIYDSLAGNKGFFDLGFSATYVKVTPHLLEYYLFIGQNYWTVNHDKNDETLVCINDLQSRENKHFETKYDLAFSYLSDHLEGHADTSTNHILLRNVNDFDLDNSLIYYILLYNQCFV